MPIINLADHDFDTMDIAARDPVLLETLRQQLVFLHGAVPFWRARLDNADIDCNGFESFTDLARIPIFTKAELRNTRPRDLLPEIASGDIRIGRWTSGTTGAPTVNFWTRSDWAAVIVSMSRMLAPQAPSEAATTFNGYSQAHVTGPFYHDVFEHMGWTVFDRSHHAEETFPTSIQSEHFDFDTLVLPARAVRGKSVGLADVLEIEPAFLSRHGVRWWVGGSGLFDATTIAAARKQGVESISNLYGSSEFAPFAVSCVEHFGDYHVAQGHVLVEVVDSAGRPVSNGATGRLIVTHLCGVDSQGEACAYTGTQLLRLATGDSAVVLREPCECGLTTPRLRNVVQLA